MPCLGSQHYILKIKYNKRKRNGINTSNSLLKTNVYDTFRIALLEIKPDGLGYLLKWVVRDLQTREKVVELIKQHLPELLEPIKTLLFMTKAALETTPEAVKGRIHELFCKIFLMFF